MIDPIFQAQLPDSYNAPLNFGATGVRPESVGWNVNSAYLTPTFMAGYRPNYSGPQNMAMPYMGFGRGFNNAMPTPFQPDVPYYMDPSQYRTHATQSMGNKAMDIAATGAQFAAGITIAAVAGNVLANKSFFTRPAGMMEMMTGANSMGRMGSAVGRGAGHVIGLATNVAARGVGWVPLVGPAASGALRTAASAMPFVGNAAGAFVGGMVLPFAAGLAAAEAANQALFRPYVAGRQGADAVSTYYRGASVGLGTSTDPLGVSGFNAARIGFGLSTEFSRRLDFKPETGAQLLQFGLQEGLYKNVQNINPQTITRRTKEIAEQVKMVMDVFNEPSIQEAVKMLGQLSMQGGVSTTAGVSKVMTAYKMAGAMTGMGTRELMGTVGMQGQMMYAQSGLVPVLGQFAALNAITGISAAHKAGLINNATLAMMGGTEGAAQLAMQANMGLAGTQYNKMMAFMQYSQGRGPAGLVNNLSNFGNFLSGGNPLRAFGAFGMNADKTLSAQQANDPTAALNVLFDQLKPMAGARNANGQYYAEALHAMMVQQGMSPQQAEALLRQYQGYSSPGFWKKYGDANRAEFLSSMEGTLEKESLLYTGQGYYIPDAWRKARVVMGDVQSSASEFWRRSAETTGILTDQIRGWAFGMSGASVDTARFTEDLSITQSGFDTKATKVRVGGNKTVEWRGGKGFNALKVKGSWTAIGDEDKYTNLILKADNIADTDPKKRELLKKIKTKKGVLSPAEQWQIQSAFGLVTAEETNNFIRLYDDAEVKRGGEEKELNYSEVDKLMVNFREDLRKAVAAKEGLEEGDVASIGKSLNSMSRQDLSVLARLSYELGMAGIETDDPRQIADFVQNNAIAKGMTERVMPGFLAGDESSQRRFMALLNASSWKINQGSNAAIALAGSLTDPYNKDSFVSNLFEARNVVAKTGIPAVTSASGVNLASKSALIQQTSARIDRTRKAQMMYDASGKMDFSGMMNVLMDSNMEAANAQKSAADMQLAAAKVNLYASMGKNAKSEAIITDALATAGVVTGI